MPEIVVAAFMYIILMYKIRKNISVLLTRLMLREVKELAQSHTAELRWEPRSGGCCS